MKTTLKISIACGLILALGACSSAQPDGASGDPAADGSTPPAADAGTDAVPPTPGAENAANPPPPGADGAAATDPAAAPPPGGDSAAMAAVASDTPAATPPPPADGSAAPAPAPVSGSAQADNSVTPPSSTSGGGSEDYKVQVGDTLMKIAFETYGDLYRWKSILEANKDKIKDPNHIPANMVIKLDKGASTASVDKNGEKYLIKTGDTLGTISKEVYGTQKKWKTIWENNKQLIHDPNKIFAGFYLYYQPDGNSPKPGDAPTTQPAPMADAAPPAAAPGTNTASTTGDPSARAPASADMPPPPAADPSGPPPTATQ